MKHIICFLVFVMACAREPEMPGIPEFETYVVELAMPESVNSLEIPVTIKFWGTNGCYTFKRLEVSQTEQGLLSVTVFSYNPFFYDGSVACPNSNYEKDTNQVITAPGKGDFTVSFNRGELTRKIKVL